jgi:Zn-dependent peptidase ImmA (M78 family)/transcriptional regulator with XRE-family HTH domain
MTDVKRFNREMLALARDVREATQEELAASSGLSQALISKAEHGLIDPSDDAIEKMAAKLGFPVSFFLQSGRRVGLPHFHLRQRAKIPAKSLARIEAIVNIRRQHVSKLLRSFDRNLEKPIPQIDIDEKGLTPEVVAARMREYWLVARGPVPSVTDIIESAGGIVIVARFGTALIDGISMRSEGLPPLFFMNSDTPGDRYRFSLAKELGHIIMHNVPDDDDRMEKDAHRFAAAFLLPAQDVTPYIAECKITNLSRVKAFWNVSIRDLIARAYDLKLMTDYQFKTLNAQYKKMFEGGEPMTLAQEQPLQLKAIVHHHVRTLGYSVSDIARLLCVDETYVQQAYLGDRRSGLRLVSSNDA